MSIFSGSHERTALIDHLQARFTLDWKGVHGVAHWSRVWTNGRRLAELEEERGGEVDRGVVELFAWLHDSCRMNDGHDPDHGPRAAALAAQLSGEFFMLSNPRLVELQVACEGHTRGGTIASPTVMVCWDSDRLDLGRVGIRPNPLYLCTAGAKREDVLSWGLMRSQKGMGEEP
jgi:uncharacterized protein